MGGLLADDGRIVRVVADKAFAEAPGVSIRIYTRLGAA